MVEELSAFASVPALAPASAELGSLVLLSSFASEDVAVL